MPTVDVAARGPRRTDYLVAAGCWLVVCGVLLALPLLARADHASVGFVEVGSPGWWFCFATVTGQAVVIVWARSVPRAVLILVAAAALPLAWAATGDSFSLTSAAITVTAFLAGVRLPLRDLPLTLAVAAILLGTAEFLNGVVGGRLEPGAALGAALLQVVGAIGLPLLVATVVKGRREVQQARRDALRAIAREHDALVQVAISQERTAMARELHDIAAHHLSGIALMAAAIDGQIDTDPETAKRSVQQVRAQSTAVLRDLRRLVGLMRDDADAPRSVETLEAIGELVDQRRAGGAPVELRLLPDGSTRRLGEGIGPLAQLALYRIAQESLTNAARHAPGARTVVEIDDRQADHVALSVTNEAGPPTAPVPPGFGLIGMRERAELLGATLRYGSTVNGGWEVRVTIPRDSTGRVGAKPAAAKEEDA